MLNTTKILNEYGLTIEEAEKILQSDIFRQLLDLQENSGGEMVFQVNTLDDTIVRYLKSPEVAQILESNRKEPIQEQSMVDVELGGFDDSIDLGDFDIELGDYDVRIVDDVSEGEKPKSKAPSKPKEKPMGTTIVFRGVGASVFFLEIAGEQVPQLDSNGSLVVTKDKVTIKAKYQVDFGTLSTLMLNDELMDLTFMAEDKSVLSENTPQKINGIEGEKVNIELSEMKAEIAMNSGEITPFYTTQEYQVGGTNVNTSFSAISNATDEIDKGDSDRIVYPVGKALHPDSTWRSNFYISPKSLYGLANCEDFFQVSVASYNYMTNYCEGNDLEQLRIFETGGDHLNVPFNNTRNETITSRKISNDAFAQRVNTITKDAMETNDTLVLVGFTPNLPKEVKYKAIDTISRKGGYMVYVNPATSVVFYIPSVVANYFAKFYNISSVAAGTNANKKHYTILFKSGDNVMGFMLLEQKHCLSASPSRLLPDNPHETIEKSRATHLSEFRNKIDIEQFMNEVAVFVGDVVEPPKFEKPQEEVDIQVDVPEQEKPKAEPKVEAQEKPKSALQEFQEQLEASQELLELLAGGDEETLQALRDQIEVLEFFISQEPDESITIEPTNDEEVELGIELLNNDQEILPNPSADDPIAEAIIEEEVEEVKEQSEPEVAVEDEDEDFEIELAKGGMLGDKVVDLIFVMGSFPDGKEFFEVQKENVVQKVQDAWAKDDHGLKDFTIFAKLADGQEVEIPKMERGGRLDEEDIKDRLYDMGVDYEDLMENAGLDLDAIQDQYLGFVYDSATNTWGMGYAKGGKVKRGGRKMAQGGLAIHFDDDYTNKDEIENLLMSKTYMGDNEYLTDYGSSFYVYSDDISPIGVRDAYESIIEEGYDENVELELFAKGGKTGKYTIHLSKDLGLDDEFKYHVVGPDGGVIGCQTKKECQEIISLAKRGMIEMEKGGKVGGDELVRKYNEIKQQGGYMNCELFCILMKDGASFKEFDKLPFEGVDKLQEGDVLQFGDDEIPRHFAIYLDGDRVLEVEQWGASPREHSLSDNLDYYYEISAVYREPDSQLAKGGKTMDDKVSDKIRLLRKEGKPQNQAVAIALSMRDSGKLASGGQTKKVLDNAKKAVADMSDAEVAETLVDVLFSSLEAFEYETTEADALKEAKKDIDHSRKLLINILEEATSIA